MKRYVILAFLLFMIMAACLNFQNGLPTEILIKSTKTSASIPTVTVSPKIEKGVMEQTVEVIQPSIDIGLPFSSPQPLPKPDQEILQRLTILGPEGLQLQPGESVQLLLGTVECCYVFQPYLIIATWSIEPSAGVSLNSETGLLEISKDAPHGSSYTINANVDHTIIHKQLSIYTPEGNPLVGYWTEVTQIPCQWGVEVEPVEPIHELAFKASGYMSVTWTPFEVYKDYWGSYTYDTANGTFSIKVDGGNYIPTDIDHEGTFTIDPEGHLILNDMWLGSFRGSTEHANCGHHFRPF